MEYISLDNLQNGSIEVTVNSDLSSVWILTELGENPKKWECILAENNVYTTNPWGNETEVKNMESNLRSNKNFWSEYKTDAEKKVINTPLEAAKLIQVMIFIMQDKPPLHHHD